MDTILVLGAGKSSSFLIEYLLTQAESKGRKVIVADLSLELAEEKIKGYSSGEAAKLGQESNEERRALISKADIVISMLPAFLHPAVAKDCLELGRHLFTASYESSEMRLLASEIERKGLLFLNECGLDPGIDHMSAMRIIAHEKSRENEILSFKSFTGGLLSPESEDNPWRYKFTWNPRNVVLAGKGMAKYIENGQYKYLPYHRLFQITHKIYLPEVGEFEGYANRDSLAYREIYGLNEIPTLLRGTLRRPGFCEAWNALVQLGLTSDEIKMHLPEECSHRGFLNSFLPHDTILSVEEKLAATLPGISNAAINKIAYLGLFSDESLNSTQGSPADLLLQILEEKWKLEQGDKDMIVMQHLFEIKTSKGIKNLSSSLVVIGEDQNKTAMAKTVGLPLAIAVDLFMDGKIKSKGLRLPVVPEIYDPILDSLDKLNIRFTESEEWVL